MPDRSITTTTLIADWLTQYNLLDGDVSTNAADILTNAGDIVTLEGGLAAVVAWRAAIGEATALSAGLKAALGGGSPTFTTGLNYFYTQDLAKTTSIGDLQSGQTTLNSWRTAIGEATALSAGLKAALGGGSPTFTTALNFFYTQDLAKTTSIGDLQSGQSALQSWRTEIGEATALSAGLKAALGGSPTFAASLNYLYTLGTGTGLSLETLTVSTYADIAELRSNTIKPRTGTLVSVLSDTGTVLEVDTAGVSFVHGAATRATFASTISLFAALTSTARITATEFYAGANVVWSAGNDGAGSGLDADLLDGNQASAFALNGHTHTIANITSLQATLDAKLLASAYTAADVFAKVLTLDGAGSLLDADLLDGNQASAFALTGHTHAIAAVTGLQAALDAKLASTSYTAADVLAKLLTVDGSLSLLDADLLDGNHASAFALASHTHAAADITSGTFADARIPSLAASKITSGVFALGQIPALPTSQITSGTFANALISAGNVTQHNAVIAPTWANVSGKPTTFTPAAHTHAATDITSGVFDQARIPALSGYLSSAGGSLSGSLAVTGAITATGDLTAFSSDRNLKIRYSDIENALNMVMGMETMIFSWTEEAVEKRGASRGTKNYGLVAQNIEAAAPHALGPMLDGYMSVKYEAIIPILVAAIQQLKRELDGR